MSLAAQQGKTHKKGLVDTVFSMGVKRKVNTRTFGRYTETELKLTAPTDTTVLLLFPQIRLFLAFKNTHLERGTRWMTNYQRRI